MYTSEQAAALQAQARWLHLRYPRKFQQMPPAQLAGIANGYGPDRWPEKVRGVITWIFRHYPAPAAIHDVRYEFSDGRADTRRAADAEFISNLEINWADRYGAWRLVNPAALYARLKLRAAGLLTAEFGGAAWRAAWRRRLNHQPEEGKLL